jgi:osmotically-inducible protein OsmY
VSIAEVVYDRSRLLEEVQASLDWEPSVEATDIGVTVDDGVVTLRGQVRSYREKETAELVALKVYGPA